MLSRDEFIEKATTGDYVAYADPGEWTIEAAALLGALAINGENYSQERLVEAIQKVALRMPGVLVMASATKLQDVHEDYVL